MIRDFYFKQFSIRQNNVAMKVGTDGVLLGSWVKLDSNLDRILDIGTGSGLIALMLAQRSEVSVIDAVEINNKAFAQAKDNFNLSIWSNRLFCHHSCFKDFCTNIERRYDLIISNPPFHKSTNRFSSSDRNMARNLSFLPFTDLLFGVRKLLTLNGTCAFVIPYIEKNEFIRMAKDYGLFPFKITNVKGSVKSPIKRTLIQFSFFSKKIFEHELIIEYSRHNYSLEYIKLVKDFYLNM